MNWSKKTHSEIISSFPELEGKPETVAAAVWALNSKSNMSADDFRKLSDKAGIRIAGRAIGSARQILGMAPKVTVTARRKTGRGPGRPRKNAAPTCSGDIVEILQSFQRREQDHERCRDLLVRIRDMVNAAL